MKPRSLLCAIVALTIALTLCSCGPFGLLPLAGVSLATSKSKDEPDEFPLTVMVDPSDGGWVEAYVGAGMVGPNGMFAPGTIVSLTAMPDSGMGYNFSYWSGDVRNVDVDTAEVLMDGPRSVTAHFSSSDVGLTVDAGGMGNPNPPEGIAQYGIGAGISCSVDSYVGDTNPTRYKCVGWDGTGSVPATGGTNDTGTFNIDVASTITWLWEVQHEVTCDVNDSMMGFAAITGGTPEGGYYPDLDSVTLEATSYIDYTFDYWEVNGSSYSTDNPTTLDIDGPKDVVAFFRAVGVSEVLLDIDSGGLGNPDPAEGGHYYTIGESVTCTVDPYVDTTSPTRSRCIGWMGTGDVPSSGATNDTGAFTINVDSSIYWEWETQHEVTISENDPARGSATVSGGNPDGNYYPDLDTVTITAIPSGIYVFDHWEVNGTDIGSSNPETLNIDMPKDVVAVFELPPPVQVDLTVDSGGMGNASPLEGTNIYDEGTSLVCTVDAYVDQTSATRSKCIGWTGTGDVPGSGTTNDTGSFVINQDSSITWQWQLQHEFILNVNDPARGSATVSGGNPDGAYFSDLDIVTIQATPIGTYIFDHWEVDGTDIGSNNPETLDIDAPRDVLAVFRSPGPAQVDLTVDSGGMGNASPLDGTNVYDEDTSLSCTVDAYVNPASPTRYKCAGWTGTGDVPGSGGTNDTGTFIIFADSTITWNWQMQHEVTSTVNNATWGSASLSGGSPDGGYYSDLDSVTLQASSNSGYAFDYWEVNGGSYSTANPVSLTIDGPKDIVAYFVEEVTLTVNASGRDAPNPPEGANTYIKGDSVSCTISSYADPSSPTRYKCAGWTGTGAVPGSGGTNNTGIFTIDIDSSITWNWQTQYEVTSSVNDGIMGSVSVAGGSPDGAYYPSADSVTLAASSNSGYVLDYWLINSIDQGSSLTMGLTINEPKDIVANFRAVVPPNADFTANVTSGMAPLTVNFTDSSTGDITSWAWAFGDGGTSSVPNPSYAYGSAGVYTVTLALSGPGGTDSNVKSAYVQVYNGNVYVATTGDDANYGTSPGDAVRTIQRGINLAQNTWTVLVGNGTYQGVGNRDIDLLGKSITVKSQNGMANCTIDCQNSGRGFYVHLGEGMSTVIDGFSIQNGSITGGGAGIYCSGASPTIRNCEILYCVASTTGGGISCGNGASPLISHCISAWNDALQGAGIFAADASPTIDNCLIVNNTSSGYGGGIYFNSTNNSIVTNCTISQNQGSQGGGVAAWQAVTAPTLRNCIIWGNTAGVGNELHAQDAPMTVEYCCFDFSEVSDPGSTIIYSGWNLGLDPQFRNPSAGDFRLKPGSQCFDSGNSALVTWPRDLDGNSRIDGLNVDMGAWELNVLRVPSEYATIGNALNNAVDWDVVLVADGTYLEYGLSFFGNTIAVLSENGAAYTTIDCEWKGRAFYFDNGETQDCVLDGFHILNGDVSPTGDVGGGIYIWNSSPTIANCLITDCMAYDGGGIYVGSGSPTIFNCTLMMNSADITGGWGGGICFSNSTAEILNCVVAVNSASFGGGIYSISSNLTMTNSTFSWNSSNSRGGALRTSSSGGVVATNCIFWENWAGTLGNEIAVGSSTAVALNYCCYDNRTNDIDNAGVFTPTACINENPLFRDPGFFDYRLGPASPCLDMGDDSVVTWMQDSDGNWRISGRYVDMGAYELYVRNVPGDAGSIAEGIADAWDWDVILVADNTYNETELNFGGKLIAVRSENGPTNCTIDCMGSGRAFYFGNGESNHAGVVGLTITNGFSSLGGAIYCDNSSPMIAECNLTWNMANPKGGAIYFSNTSAVVRSCIIRDNQATGAGATGGGIHCDANSFVTIANCLISNNWADMRGGGIAAYSGSSIEITNCTITNNWANTSGGGIYALSSDYWLYNSIFWNNFTPGAGREIHLFDAVAGAWLYNCCYSVGGTGGPGFYYFDPTCTTGNPNFVNPGGIGPGGGGDFHLVWPSPCIDMGDNGYAEWAELMYDLDWVPRVTGGQVDMGAYEWW